jgi:hypothetical protein
MVMPTAFKRLLRSSLIATVLVIGLISPPAAHGDVHGWHTTSDKTYGSCVGWGGHVILDSFDAVAQTYRYASATCYQLAARIRCYELSMGVLIDSGYQFGSGSNPWSAGAQLGACGSFGWTHHRFYSASNLYLDTTLS